MTKQWADSIINGTISGLVLGLFLWWIEVVTGEKVYTLLLNVDFIFGDITLPLWIEWLFHLIISWLVVFIYLEGMKRVHNWVSPFLYILLLSVIAAFSYIPLTLLAIKQTPSLSNGTAILFWTIGHILYAMTVYFLNKKKAT